MTKLGRLDRTGGLYRLSKVVAKSGSVTYTPIFIGRLALSVDRIPVVASLVAERDSERVDAVFTCRWFDGLTTGMQLRLEGRVYRITRIQELGRRDGWKITCREVS